MGEIVVDSGRVYFGCSGGKVYALDAETNEKQWEFETGDKIWSTPAIDGDTLYTGSFDKKLYAIDTDTGEAKWEEPFEAEGAIIATPLVYNNTVYVGAFDRYLYAVDAEDGSLRWKSEVEAGNWFWVEPVADNGIIYAGCLDGKVYILDADDGHEVADAIDLESAVSSSPVLVDDAIIFASQEGKIFSLDTENNTVTQLADLETEINSALCVFDGIIYIHTQDLILHRVDLNTGAELTEISLEKEED